MAFPIHALACFAAVRFDSTSAAKEHRILATKAEMLGFPNLAMVKDRAILVVTNPDLLTGTTIIQSTVIAYDLVTSGTLEIGIIGVFQFAKLWLNWHASSALS